MKRQGHEGRLLAEQAADWLIRLEDDHGPEENASFLNWIRQSPAHLAEFLIIARVNRLAGKIDPQRRIDVDALIARSRNVIVLPTHIDAAAGEMQPSTAKRQWFRRLARRLATLAAALALLVLTPYSVDYSHADAIRYQTAVGEQRTLTLADGSRVTLNTDSQIAVRYSSIARDIDLLDGEALFEVADSDPRPFQVASGRVLVEDLGTAFVVRRDPTESRIVVTDGHVRVLSNRAYRDVAGKAAGAVPTTELRRGDKWVVPHSAAFELEPVEHLPQGALEAETLWTTGKIAIAGATLARVVEEFNRYNVRKLVLADESLATERITIQNFPVREPVDFARSLESIQLVVADVPAAAAEPIVLRKPTRRSKHAHR